MSSPGRDPHPVNMEHPVVRVVMDNARRGNSERYAIDAQCIQRLEAALLEHASDPELAGGVLGLFALATLLFDEERSPTAATLILVTLGKLSPRLTAMWTPDALAAYRQSGRNLDALLARSPILTAPCVGDTAPKGSVKIGTLSKMVRLR